MQVNVKGVFTISDVLCHNIVNPWLLTHPGATLFLLRKIGLEHVSETTMSFTFIKADIAAF